MRKMRRMRNSIKMKKNNTKMMRNNKKRRSVSLTNTN